MIIIRMKGIISMHRSGYRSNDQSVHIDGYQQQALLTQDREVDLAVLKADEDTNGEEEEVSFVE